MLLLCGPLRVPGRCQQRVGGPFHRSVYLYGTWPLSRIRHQLTLPTHKMGSDSAFVGWVNGMYSAGRLVAAPLFGYWAERRTFREAIFVNLILFVLGTFKVSRRCLGLKPDLSVVTGNLLYAFSFSSWMILLSRTLVGLGSGTQCPCDVGANVQDSQERLGWREDISHSAQRRKTGLTGWPCLRQHSLQGTQ